MGRMRTIITCLIVFLLCFQGCATNKPFVGRDMTSIAPLKIVRYETPVINRVTQTGEILGILGVIDVTGITKGIPTLGELAYMGMGKDKSTGSILDFGKLVTDKFVERVRTEIHKWPTITVREEPIKNALRHVGGPPRDRLKWKKELKLIEKAATSISSGTLLVFKFDELKIYYRFGFISRVKATMKDSGGKILWQKAFRYVSKDFGRTLSIDTYESGNYKVLNNEMEFAAEKTVSNFIEHLKRSMEI